MRVAAGVELRIISRQYAPHLPNPERTLYGMPPNLAELAQVLGVAAISCRYCRYTR
mgnify:CR=1 FL=1